MMFKLNPNERLVVESGLNRYKVVGPGRIWLAPWQTALTRLYIGPQEMALSFVEIPTGEHIPVDVELRLLYQIDPALFSPALLPQLPRLNEGGWAAILRWRTEYVLRPLIAAYGWRELGQPVIQQRVERHLRQTLTDLVQPVGLSLPAASLVKVGLPAELQQTLLQAERDSLEPLGRAEVLKRYVELFGPDLAEAMPYIVQWEVLNALHKEGHLQILLTDAGLLDGRSPRSEPLFQLPLQFHQRN